MKLHDIIAKYSFALTMAVAASGCQPEEFEGEGNGIAPVTADPSFTIDPITVEGRSNTYVVRLNNTENVLGVRWSLAEDLSDDLMAFGLPISDTVFLPDADVYEFKSRVITKGGKEFFASQLLTVETPDPNYGNLLRGGRFKEGDEQHWSIKQYGGGVVPEFINGRVTFNYGGWAHAGIYQSFEADAGKYQLNMTVIGNGATNTWFEVYIGKSDPATFPGDYNEGGVRLGLNTWTGCGNTPFNGKLADLACVGSASGEADGVIELETGGTYYIVIRTGGENLGDSGIHLDNIELRPYLD